MDSSRVTDASCARMVGIGLQEKNMKGNKVSPHRVGLSQTFLTEDIIISPFFITFCSLLLHRLVIARLYISCKNANRLRYYAVFVRNPRT